MGNRIVRDARRDLISELPVEIKDRILECLSTRDAARTALLSTHWKDVWSRHGRLVFDDDFFEKCKRNETATIVNTINNILLFRAGPVKKFTLIIFSYPKPHQSDIERWCLFLSRSGVEELNLIVSVPECTYKLPVCIFSCPTIKRMNLGGLLLDFPVNADCIFPGATSLCFTCLELKPSVNVSAYIIPNLEKLGFHGSIKGINNFEFSAPKLKSLSGTDVYSGISGFESRWFSLLLKEIKTLCLSGNLLPCDCMSMLPTAMNLEVTKLYEFNFSCVKQLTGAMQLLQKSPNLCELGISAAKRKILINGEDKEAASRLLGDPDSCFINQDLKMLKTVKIERFSGSQPQNLFVKSVFSKSPALERVVIQESDEIKASFKILRELSCFPRSSPKAQLVYMEYNSTYSLVDSGLL